jgi:hypothetical protein
MSDTFPIPQFLVPESDTWRRLMHLMEERHVLAVAVADGRAQLQEFLACDSVLEALMMRLAEAIVREERNAQ